MKTFISFLFSGLFFLNSYCQTQTITLTFTGKDASTQSSIPLDEINIQNVWSGCDTTIFGASPSLSIKASLGIDDPSSSSGIPFSLGAAVPNPSDGISKVRVIMNRRAQLNLKLTDAQGKVLSSFARFMNSGPQEFEIETSSGNTFLLNASSGSFTESVKLICNNTSRGPNHIRWIGSPGGTLKSSTNENVFVFHIGDQLSFKSVKPGYYDNVFVDSPTNSTSYTFVLTPLPQISAPTVITDSVTEITQTTAICSGNVTADGGDALDARGVCWSLSENPTTNDNHTLDGNTTGGFSSFISGLTADQTYHARAYATNSAGTSYGADIEFHTLPTIPPGSDLYKLTGGNSKTWKLIRVTNSNRYPLEVGPWDHSTIWWGMGFNNDELSNRPCMLNDEWIFSVGGVMTYNSNEDYWAEGGIFNPSYVCSSTSDPMTGINGEDLSAWKSGIHNFRLSNSGSPKITAIGRGAFIGFIKLGNGIEVSSTNPITQPDSVTYDLVKLYDGDVDTLIVEGQYRWDATDGGYWRFVLVHYDNPANEPPIPGNKPTVGFHYTLDLLSITCINTSTGATSYFWDFGDGGTSTQANPVHTYATAGMYTITLTATNPNGSSTMSLMVFISSATVTDALIQGGPWRVKADDMTVFVGPALGDGSWWSVPKEFLTGGTAGTADDWSCMPDDQFTFGTGGLFTYSTQGSARNDGYFGGMNGCIDDATIAASGNGAAFGSATHSYVLTPATASSRPIITLTNGAGKAAFIGFYKGYYGGENVDRFSAPNGGSPTNRYEVMGYANNGNKEYLFVSVDISVMHDGSAAWSVIMER